MKKVIILLGPTGVGKTSASLILAKHLNTEIISSDSMQIYKHMDIGTAKPSKEQMQMIRHHMIDIVEPWELYSTGEYIKAVQPIIERLHSEGKIPIVVGGTGLYLKAMTRGIFSGPSADWDMRNELIQKEETKPGFLYEYLKELDLEAASKIMPSDIRRTIRAIEVCLKSKKTITELCRFLTKPLPYEFIKIGIMRERKELYNLINQRVDGMIKDGLIEEVKEVIRLIQTFALPYFRTSTLSLSSMQAIGYKEIAMYLNGQITIDEAINTIKTRSRNYAKRQITWFKKEESIKWIDITGIYEPYEIFKKIMPLLEKTALQKYM